MKPVLGIVGDQFTLNGCLTNEGHRLRGAPLAGRILGIEFRVAPDPDQLGVIVARASRAGLNALGITVAADHRGVVLASADERGAIESVANAGIVPFVRVVDPRHTRRAPWNVRPKDQERIDPAGTIDDEQFGPQASVLAPAWDRGRPARSGGDEAAHQLASLPGGTIALVTDVPHRVGSDPAARTLLIAASRIGGAERVLVGSRAFAADPSARPDFVVMPSRWPAKVRGHPWPPPGRTLPTLPTIRSGDGHDLDDPDGGLRRALHEGASWFLQVRRPLSSSPSSIDRIDAFLETVRAARAVGRAPSDHPTVALADQRHAFRRHADAIRTLGLRPANALGSAPR